jgi:hypothetical protein
MLTCLQLTFTRHHSQYLVLCLLPGTRDISQYRLSELVAKTRLGTNVKKVVLAASFDFTGKFKSKDNKISSGKEKEDGVVVLGKEEESMARDPEEEPFYFEGRKVFGIRYRVVEWTGKVKTTDSV